MAVDVNGLACSLHHPTVYSHQKGGQSFLTSTAPSCHVAVSSGILPGDAKHLGLDILCVVDRSGTCKAESYLEKPAFTKACLFDVRVNMFMRVPLVKLLCQTVMRWIPALKYLQPGVRGACGHVLSCQTINAAASRDPSTW
jgi:hypothetical protein